MSGPYEVPTTPPDVLAGMLALTLDEAMQRLHNVHTSDWTSWRECVTSTLCQEAVQLIDAPETQLAVLAAKTARGEVDG